MTTPADRGLQVERTGLAWRRTSLGVAIGALLCLRLLPPRLGAAGVMLAVLGLCWSADLALIGSRRLRDAATSRANASRPGDPDAGLPALHDGALVARTAALTGLVGVVAFVTTVVLAARPG